MRLLQDNLAVHYISYSIHFSYILVHSIPLHFLKVLVKTHHIGFANLKKSQDKRKQTFEIQKEM